MGLERQHCWDKQTVGTATPAMGKSRSLGARGQEMNPDLAWLRECKPSSRVGVLLRLLPPHSPPAWKVSEMPASLSLYLGMFMPCS